MKALILAAGRGKRMDHLSANTNKCLIPVRDKPLIEYSLDRIASLTDISEIVIVVGHHAESIINRYGINYCGKKITYRIQFEQHGLVHALETAIPDLGGEDFLLFLGDEIVLGNHHQAMIESFYKNRAHVICGVINNTNFSEIRKTYAVIQDTNNAVFRLIEKPQKQINNIMGTGNCIFKYEMVKYIPKVPIHHIRKEKELPDLIQCAIDEGHQVKSFFFSGGYFNANTCNELQSIEENWIEIAGKSCDET